jgi:hypothetical protein
MELIHYVTLKRPKTTAERQQLNIPARVLLNLDEVIPELFRGAESLLDIVNLSIIACPSGKEPTPRKRKESEKQFVQGTKPTLSIKKRRRKRE